MGQDAAAHVADRRRIDRLRLRRAPRSGSASACSAAPRSTSRSRRASSPTSAWSGRSATTSATTSIAVLDDRGIDTADIERVEGGETFFWRGHYEHDMNVAHTDDTQLNVFADFEPKLSRGLARRRDALPRQHPARPPAAVRAAVRRAEFAALDSMNLWIDTARDSLVAAIGEVDCLLLNDAEIRMLTGEPNLANAAAAPMAMGPSVVVAKRGEYGAVLFTRRGLLRDPGPAAGGRPRPDRRRRQLRRRLPRLPRQRRRRRATTTTRLRQAMAYGSVMASFNVEDFGTERLERSAATRSPSACPSSSA